MVNISKTKEIVFHRPSAKPPVPCLLTDIEQVVTAKLLGVTFSQSLSFECHVSNILTTGWAKKNGLFLIVNNFFCT